MTRAAKVLKYLHRVAPREISRSSLLALDELAPDVLANLHIGADPARFTQDAKLQDWLRNVPLAPPTATVAGPLFFGTLVFARIIFVRSGQPDFAMSAADVQTAVSYATRAVVPIHRYVSQYGPSSVAVSPTVIPFTANLSGDSFTQAELEGWVEQIAQTARSSNVVNPCVIMMHDRSLPATPMYVNHSDPYHQTAGDGTPYCYCLVFGQNLTVADDNHTISGLTRQKVYAHILSHEIAEMVVDPAADMRNPEVCDACAGNCRNDLFDLFDQNGVYMGGTADTSTATGFSFFINSIVRPDLYDSVTQCVIAGGDSQAACVYAPPPAWQHLSPIPGHTLQADFDCSGLANAGRSVSVGDVDGDGRAEVIVQIDAANSGGNDFWVMKFDPAADGWQHLSPIPGHALQADFDCSGLANAGRSVNVGDVDGDGRAEVIVQIDAANSGGNDFWVMKFDPAGFSPAHWQHLSPIPGHALQADFDCSGLPNAARSVRVGDVDGDGRAEVIVQIDAAHSGGNDFWVMKFDPAGGWRHLSPIPGHALQADFDCSGLANAARSVSMGDVDGDGRAEVIVQIDAANSGGNDFWVMKFDPVARNWRHLSPIPGHALQADFDCSGLPNAARSVRVADVDGDGRAEVIVQIDAANSGGNDFWVMKFDPAAGNWRHLSPIPGHALQADFDCSGLANAGRSVSVGDVDHDGRAEVIVQIDASGAGGNDFWVMKYQPANGNWVHLSPTGDGLEADIECSRVPNGGRSVSMGDVDGDGGAEVIVQIDATLSGRNDFWVMKWATAPTRRRPINPTDVSGGLHNAVAADALSH
jgi:hypothetical protein